MTWQDVVVPTVAAVLVIAAAPVGNVRIDTWDTYPPGPLSLTGTWQPYPHTSAAPLKTPPAIVSDGPRRALRLKTDHESVTLGRTASIEAKRTPRLMWEWKAVLLPAGGDVRDSRRNDQAARILLLFQGMKALIYVWDTAAPVGEVVHRDLFETVDRALIVVRSGPRGVGQWHREERDVYRDYRRVFEAEPRTITWIGLESHSDDVGSESEVLFGTIQFRTR